ncbi:restriction endonuclease subunit S [Rhizobium laguerreae]|uniref:restriction endonuclease subunit S n=1 Tax=Rhizobium laguerreae TaxID=1076926 RepID=UPI001C90AA74|nr:restriction endonuclease subunit S [Rhizobium laguerreae]MBY3202000.1 restriction endonuclease subunit S [Rhizobium laguerreae]
MSSKGKSSADTGSGATLVPKLRFPEFQDAGGWEYKVLAPFLRDSSGRAPSNTTLPVFSSTREGLRRQDAYFDGRVLQNNNDYGVVPPGCFVYRHMSDDGTFKFNINDTGAEIAVSKEYPVFETVGLDSKFLLELLNEGEDFKHFAFSQKAGGTRTRLYFSRLREWRTHLPTLAEQQKIADCLDSADALIAAQGRKVEALRAHKKGLMQQLFPQEGETQPRLRFPEFRSAGQWKEKSLSTLCDVKHGYAFEGEFFANEGEYVLLTPGNFYESGGYRDQGSKQKYYTGEIPAGYVLNQGDLLVAMTEQAKGLLGSPILVPESNRFLHNQRLGLVTNRPGVEWANEFFFHFFNTDAVRKAIQASASGAKVRHTSPTKIGDIVSSYPTSVAEQQCIADCLTSLDDLIAAETRKLDTLKTHKKGLMQQLFPAIEGFES